MGTNYYARLDACPHCGRSDDELHIGKSSGGWTFSFRAHENIRSWRDWQEFLAKPNVRIFDEYGEEKTVTEFTQLVESKRSEKFNHARDVGVKDSPYSKYMREQYRRDSDFFESRNPSDFLDPEGNSFSDCEFS